MLLEDTKMSKTEQMNIKITLDMRDMLEAIGVFEGLDPNELVRGWIADKIGEYRKDRIFQRELNDGHLKKEKDTSRD